MQITNFQEAQDALRPFYANAQTKYTLDVMYRLMDYLGNPQNKLNILHVAGTSGKTSTAYYSAALLQAAGYSVGLTVSPHVDHINERLQIDGQPLPEAEFCALLSEFLALIAASGIKPSYFELLTALAFWQFDRAGVDYAVMEVGLGGRLDATNVISRPDKICLITDIGLDHTEILGDTLGQIAGEKAGIIQQHNPVFIYEQGAEVMTVMQAVAESKAADIHILQPDYHIDSPDLPSFQRRNLGLAAQAVTFTLQRAGGRPVTPAQLQQAARVTVPARLERFTVGDKTVITDGSHNQQKLQALIGALREIYPGQPVAVLAAFVSGGDKRWQGGLGELLPLASHVTFTSFSAESDLPRSSVDPSLLATYAKQQGYTEYDINPDTAAAFLELLQRPEAVLLVTGSFYLLNHIRPHILKRL